MTIRDKLREICPRALDSRYEGGVKGCPSDYPGLEHYCLHGCSAGDDCEACWSQEYREEPEPKQKKFDASVVFIVLAVLEALWSIIAVVQGDSERLRFCCVMGLLYVIAAGVWRTNQ